MKKLLILLPVVCLLACPMLAQFGGPVNSNHDFSPYEKANFRFCIVDPRTNLIVQVPDVVITGTWSRRVGSGGHLHETSGDQTGSLGAPVMPIYSDVSPLGTTSVSMVTLANGCTPNKLVQFPGTAGDYDLGLNPQGTQYIASFHTYSSKLRQPMCTYAGIVRTSLGLPILPNILTLDYGHGDGLGQGHTYMDCDPVGYSTSPGQQVAVVSALYVKDVQNSQMLQPPLIPLYRMSLQAGGILDTDYIGSQYNFETRRFEEHHRGQQVDIQAMANSLTQGWVNDKFKQAGCRIGLYAPDDGQNDPLVLVEGNAEDVFWSTQPYRHFDCKGVATVGSGFLCPILTPGNCN